MTRVNVQLGHFVGLSAMVLALGCSGSVDQLEPDPAQSYAQLKLEISGGYGPAPCSNGTDSYEVTRRPGHLTWAGCDYSQAPAESVMGDRPLSDAEVDSVTKALRKVGASTAKNCGADAPLLTLDVTTNSGVERYADDFYSGCPWDALAGRTFVTGLDDLANVLSELAKQQ